ncbi:MAG: glycosyltransferase family protein [Betaproteobacteria bacterium]|nr:glycosyltransferase family protein [Betaproteobacteria bacterium]
MVAQRCSRKKYEALKTGSTNPRMHLADVTMFYAESGGGVRRYIEAKRSWLRTAAACSHTLVVPKARAARPEAHTVALASVPLPFSQGYRVPLGRARAARELIALAPTLIEAGDPYTLAWAALDAGRDLGIPVVAFCHSDLPRLVGTHCGARAERFASSYCRRLYTRFDLVLAPSRAMAARLASWGVDGACYQPLGVDLDVFHPDRRSDALRQTLGVAPGTRLLVYAGRFAPEKNLDVLADAMRLLGSRYVCLLVGAGTPPRGLPGNVRVLGYQRSRVELAELIASCDLFVHPGDQETFGLAALEAMACGVPVVGADAAGIAELVPARAGVLVMPRDARALAGGIETVFDGNRVDMAIAAREAAQAYGWTAVLATLMTRYTQLTARSEAHA